MIWWARWMPSPMEVEPAGLVWCPAIAARAAVRPASKGVGGPMTVMAKFIVSILIESHHGQSIVLVHDVDKGSGGVVEDLHASAAIAGVPIHAAALIEDHGDEGFGTGDGVGIDGNDPLVAGFGKLDGEGAGGGVTGGGAGEGDPQAGLPGSGEIGGGGESSGGAERGTEGGGQGACKAGGAGGNVKRAGRQETTWNTTARTVVWPSGTSLKFKLGVSSVTW